MSDFIKELKINAILAIILMSFCIIDTLIIVFVSWHTGIILAMVTCIYIWILRFVIYKLNKTNEAETIDNFEEEQQEYTCFICKDKFMSRSKFENNHPLCNEECAKKYIDNGFTSQGSMTNYGDLEKLIDCKSFVREHNL